eukprot:TRINITY_DN8036_c0_g1_i5.p1 TRINITY_DN8036_c0_g1~~TRINITY_DN8036_c0_g1_i5.p1  ORF type:complete len:586 (+),score=92.47 TRINITY_DN8036_c0_g1_i5:66-1823(+)
MCIRDRGSGAPSLRDSFENQQQQQQQQRQNQAPGFRDTFGSSNNNNNNTNNTATQSGLPKYATSAMPKTALGDMNLFSMLANDEIYLSGAVSKEINKGGLSNDDFSSGARAQPKGNLNSNANTLGNISTKPQHQLKNQPANANTRTGGPRSNENTFGFDNNPFQYSSMQSSSVQGPNNNLNKTPVGTAQKINNQVSKTPGASNQKQGGNLTNQTASLAPRGVTNSSAKQPGAQSRMAPSFDSTAATLNSRNPPQRVAPEQQREREAFPTRREPEIPSQVRNTIRPQSPALQATRGGPPLEREFGARVPPADYAPTRSPGPHRFYVDDMPPYEDEYTPARRTVRFTPSKTGPRYSEPRGPAPMYYDDIDTRSGQFGHSFEESLYPEFERSRSIPRGDPYYDDHYYDDHVPTRRAPPPMHPREVYEYGSARRGVDPYAEYERDLYVARRAVPVSYSPRHRVDDYPPGYGREYPPEYRGRGGEYIERSASRGTPWEGRGELPARERYVDVEYSERRLPMRGDDLPPRGMSRGGSVPRDDMMYAEERAPVERRGGPAGGFTSASLSANRVPSSERRGGPAGAYISRAPY